MSRRRQPRRDERGMVIIIVALGMVALVALCAVVIDIAVLKSDWRADRDAADAAATAASLSLDGSTAGPANACAAAWDVALRNLQLDPTLPSPCAPFVPTTACDPAVPIQAVGSTPSGVTITVTIPVTDVSPLMSGSAIGGDKLQVDVGGILTDGSPCQRVGVKISRTRSSLFAGIIGRTSGSTTVHSVARFGTSSGRNMEIPALSALNKTACPAIEASSGNIHVYAAGSFGGVIHADSAASSLNCGSSTVYDAGGPGTITADPSSTGVPGKLEYSVPSQSLTQSFSSTGTYTGTKKYSLPITRQPADTVYHCGNLSPRPTGCTTGAGGTDAISNLQARYSGATALLPPSGFTVFPNTLLGQSCGSLPATFAAGNWYINCPGLNLTSPLSFASGDVIFSGDLHLGSSGVLTVNSANASTTAPAGSDSTLVIQGTGGLTTSSNGWQLNLYRTTLLMTNVACQTVLASCGTLALQNGSANWTPPQAGPTKGLIYWSETSQAMNFQGNPSLTWDGVFFSPAALLNLQGAAVVNATNVQLWVDSVALNNTSAQLLLKPDPSTAIGNTQAVSSLVR